MKQGFLAGFATYKGSTRRGTSVTGGVPVAALEMFIAKCYRVIDSSFHRDRYEGREVGGISRHWSSDEPRNWWMETGLA